ncbi:hypothetical protein ACH47Z_28680 [Streptomyces sp. NPDC020192]|uniref:hypothetical protein n=1 Tax=Streptomyces sp. NPDC020192 TaxID=3365066 RepID=UPI00378FDF53
MSNRVVPHWEQARAQARQFRGLDGNERDVLALIYALVAIDDSTAIDAISHWAVRYRLSDPQQLHQDLSALLPGPLDQGATTVQDGRAELRRSRLSELVDEDGWFTGDPKLESLLRPEIEAVIAERGEFSGRPPLEGRIWRLWAALQAPHGVPYEDTLTSDELAAYDASGGSARYAASGKTIFEHSLQALTQVVDRMLLAVSGAPPMGTEVLVTAGVHQGRSGRLTSVTWTADDEQHVCSEPPASFRISFDDCHEYADVPPAALEPLPDWDRHFAIVHAGQPMPMSWDASVLLAGAAPEASSLQHGLITALKAGWRQTGQTWDSRLVVLIPHQASDRPASDQHSQWLHDAYTWTDEIVLMPAPGTDLSPLLRLEGIDLEDARDHLTLHVTEPDEATRAWAEQHSVPLAHTPSDAAAVVLKRLDRGWKRRGGQRQVPLSVVSNTGYHYWQEALRDAGRTLDAASIGWARRNPIHPEYASWWAMNARIRHPDHQVTNELVVGRTSVLSVVIFVRRHVWTDSEVVVLRDPNSLGTEPLITAPTRFPVRLPSMDMDIAFYRRGDGRDRPSLKLVSELGLTVAEDRLRGLSPRPESNLLASQRSVVCLELSEDEFGDLKARRSATGETALPEAVEIHRVADLLSDMGGVLCDWATLGTITRAVVPTWPPASGDLTDRRL